MGYPNLLTFPEAFDNAAWVKGNATVTADATADPLGGTGADKIVATAVNLQHNVTQTYVKVAVEMPLVFSVYLKSAEYTTASFYLFDGASFPILNANLATGAIISTAANGTVPITASGIIDAGGGWYRVWMANTWPAASASVGARIFPNTANAYLGDGTSGVYAFGARLEQGGGPGSYRTATRKKPQVPAGGLLRAIRRMPLSRTN